jgi:GNAT superfamily N-acetyltransferase
MEFRRAQQHEGRALAQVWLRSRRAAVAAIPPPVQNDGEVRTWFRDLLAGREVWIAETDGAVVALLVLDGRWVDQLYVHPAWTGEGIGSRLLQVAKQRHPDGLDLWTFQSNSGARRFYERHGFVAIEATDGDNEEGAPDLHYEWRDGGGPTP